MMQFALSFTDNQFSLYNITVFAVISDPALKRALPIFTAYRTDFLESASF